VSPKCPPNPPPMLPLPCNTLIHLDISYYSSNTRPSHPCDYTRTQSIIRQYGNTATFKWQPDTCPYIVKELRPPYRASLFQGSSLESHERLSMIKSLSQLLPPDLSINTACLLRSNSVFRMVTTRIRNLRMLVICCRLAADCFSPLLIPSAAVVVVFLCTR
jgi:hypothetical protein